jgi:hypothetical protein
MNRTLSKSGWTLMGIMMAGTLLSSAVRADEARAGREPHSVGQGSSASAGQGSEDRQPVVRTHDRPSGTVGRAQQPDDRRGDARHRHSNRGGYRPPYYGPGYWGWGYPYSWYWGSAWGPSVYYSSGPRGRSVGYFDDGDEAGALDLDLAPEKAEVYVDGRLVGRADDFDGFPTYLWLPRGTYDVVFYLDGYRTLARQYSIYPGLVIDVEDQMEPGESVRPEAMVPQSTERRDDRLRRDAERRAEADRRGDVADTWRDREREPDTWRERREEADDERERAAQVQNQRSDDAVTVRLRVEPIDATVYLDGKFLGEAGDVAASLTVAEGAHTIELVRPGYRSTTRTFSAQRGDALTLDLRLEQE